MSPRKPPLALTAVCLALAFAPDAAHAQLGRKLRKAAERGVTRALERNTEEKTEEAVDEVFEGGDKRDDGSGSVAGGASTPPPAEAGAQASVADGASPGGGTDAAGVSEAAAPTFSMTSKFDFEPGAEVIQYDDFSRTAVGDLPTGYNTMGGLEVVTVSTAPGKWIKLNKSSGQVVAFDFTEFPENFTLEFDLIHDIPDDEYRFKGSVGVMLTSEADPEAITQRSLSRVGDRNVIFWVSRNVTSGWSKRFTKSAGGKSEQGNSGSIAQHFSGQTRGLPQHIAIWRQGKRMRMYVNDEKAYDIPLAWSGEEEIRGLRFVTDMSVDEDTYLLSNVRLAKGAPDTRSKLETEGKLTTYGITFASGSADVEPASAGTLKRIAQTLEANPDMRLRITGHTDADGDEAANQTLSEQRAASVSAVLAESYGIDAGRLETAGMGETDPLSTEGTPAAKARNRRVVLEVI